MDQRTNRTTMGSLEGVTSGPQTTFYDKNKGLFWGMLTLYVCIAVITAIGNGLVIYATYGKRNAGPLRYLDPVIKSLAVSDMLFGVLGTPFLLVSVYMGE